MVVCICINYIKCDILLKRQHESTQEFNQNGSLYLYTVYTVCHTRENTNQHNNTNTIENSRFIQYIKYAIQSVKMLYKRKYLPT